MVRVGIIVPDFNAKAFSFSFSEFYIGHGEENIGKTFFDINHNNICLGQSPKATEIKTKINNWYLIKHRICITKETISKPKDNYTVGENICK